MKIKRILFVCKYNRFRSKVSEEMFKELNKDKNIEVGSAASESDYIPVAKNVQKVLQELGYKPANPTPKKLTQELIDWADLIIVAADNVKVKTDKKIIYWKISDTSQDDYKGILERAKDIEKRIKKLITMLK